MQNLPHTKKFLTKGIILLLILLVAGNLFLPYQAAEAALPLLLPLVGKTLTGLGETALDALDFVDNTILKLYVNLLWLTGLASVFLVFSAKFLDWAALQPINLDNDLVRAGWDFTSGFVNIIFILIFLFIALAYILKQESWGMKKALPNLIIMALLINFSLLFVKIFVDIGQIILNSFQNAFFDQGGSLALTVIDGIKGKLMEVFGKLAIQIGGYLLVAWVPFISVVKLLRIAQLAIGEAFLGTLSQSILLIIFGFLGGLIFLVYGVLFLVRVVIIWLLAIAAPLAFAAYILPQTQKYFKQWFDYLLGWVSLGIVIFFLMGLGLKLYLLVAPAGFINVALTKTDVNFTEGYLQFIFLLIYLLVTLFVAKKFTPKGIDFIIKAVTAGGMAAGGVALAGGWRLGKMAQTKVAGETAKIRRTYEAGKRMGLPFHRAAGEAVKRYWQRKALPAIKKIKPETVGRTAQAAARGAGSAFKDMGEAFFRKALKIPKKKKGQALCAACGGAVPAGASFCPHCGTPI